MIVNDKKLRKIEQDYLKGLTYKEIEKKHKITFNQLQYLIRSNKWKRESNRSEVQKGNQNAVGNSGGHAPEKNKNAVTTGEFETIYKEVLTENEMVLYEKYEIEDPKEKLKEEIKMLTIREIRMLERIKKLKDSGKDLTIQSITRTKTGTTEYGGMASENNTTFAEATDDKIQRIEEALTRVQESKRRAIESLHKFDIENNRLELELLKFEREVAGDEAQNSGQDSSNDDSLIAALNIKAKEVWSDAEK